MDANKRKRLIITIEVLTGLLITAIVATVIVLSDLDGAGRGQCALAHRPAPFQVDRMKYVAARDNASLVSIWAHLEVSSWPAEGAPAERWYAPIALSGVSLGPGPDGSRELRLDSPCAQLTLRLAKWDAAIVVADIQVVALAGSALSNCSTGETSIYFGENFGYMCYLSQRYLCMELPELGREPSAPRRVELELEALRFELDGNPTLIAKGEFSEPAHECA